MTDEEARKVAEYCGEERRHAHEGWISKVQSDVSVLMKQMLEVKSFQGQAKVAYGILMIIFVGGFFYTYNHKQEAASTHNIQRAENEAEFNKFHREINTNTKDIGRLEGRILLVDDRYSRLLVDIASLTQTFAEYVKENRQLNKIQRVEIENYNRAQQDREEQGRHPVP